MAEPARPQQGASGQRAASGLSRAQAEAIVAHLPELVHSKTAARVFDVSLRTLRRWVAADRLRALRTGAKGGGRLRITRESIVDLLVEMSGRR